MAKNKLNKELDIYATLAGLKSAVDVQEFLVDLCTPSELRALSERWRVAQLVNKGTSYRQINEETGVSTTTVTRVARILEDGVGYRKILDGMTKNTVERVSK